VVATAAGLALDLFNPHSLSSLDLLFQLSHGECKCFPH